MRVVKKFKKKFECFTINNNRIYLGNSNQVDVYCLESDLKIEILKFNNLITCVIVQDDYLYTGSMNGDVKIWCLKTNQKVAQFSCQTQITCMIVHENFLYTAAENIKIFSLGSQGTPREVATLSGEGGHRDKITCLAVDPRENGYLYSGSQDHTIRAWSLTTFLEEYTIEEQQTINCLAIHDGRLFYNTIKVWCLDTRRIINNLAGHPDYVRCLVVNGNKLYSSSRDLIKIWSLQTFENIETLSGHFFMFHLGISKDYLYSGSHNGIIQLWSDRIGSLNRELKLIDDYLENYSDNLINVCLRCFLLEEIKSLTYEIV